MSDHAEDSQQWKELGEEEPTPQEETVAEEQPVEEAPAEEAAAEEEQWKELGEEEPAAEEPAAEEETPAEEPAAEEETPAEEEAAAEEPAAEEEAVAEEPAEEEAAAEEPAAEEETPAEEPAAEEETPAEEPAAEEETPAEEEPAAEEEAAAEEPAAEEETPAEEEAAAEEPAAEEEAAAEEPAAEEETPAEEPAAEEEAVAEEPAAEEETPAEEPAAEEETPAEEEPAAEEEAAAEEPAAEETPAEEDQWKELGEEEPAAEQPAEEETPAEEPAAEEEAAAEEPAAEEETPAEEEPAAEEEAAAEEPAAEEETPAEEPAAEETPAEEDQWKELGEEEPAAEQPAEEETPAEEPAAEEPASEEPVEEEQTADENADDAEKWKEHGEEAPATEEPAEEEQAVAMTRAVDTTAAPAQNLEKGRIVKAHARFPKALVGWEDITCDAREDSDDEFELATCKAPVYEEEAESETKFKNGYPDFKGEVMSCFDEPNLLYRIINRDEKTWAFYNDSVNYEMHVQFTFGKHSKLEALENTTMNKQDSGEHVCEVVVYPCETELFVKGSVNGFTSKLRAIPLSENYHKSRRDHTEAQIQEETENIRQVCSSESAEEVLQACIANNIPFVDPEFPPCQASLETGAKKPFKPLAWARPSMYLPTEMASQVRLFRGNVQAGTVDPGDLGDSWVMCSVATLTEDPARLMDMFRHPEGKAAATKEQAVGAYRVTFNKNGWWRSVIVDNYLPVSAGKPKYARSATDPAEIWPCILEKAFAKIHGSYGVICSGDPLHALQDMTGFSTVRVDDSLKEDDTNGQVFDDFVSGVDAGYTIICNTPGKEPRMGATGSEQTEAYKRMGLLTGHAYTILDAKHFPDIDTRLVKVRNVWGRGLQWNGEWGDEDSKWEEHPEVAEACNFQKGDHSAFWMTWEAASKHFNGGGVSFSHTPTFDYRVNCAFSEQVPSCVLEVEVTTPTCMTLVISQEDKRGRKGAVDYQPVMISVAKPYNDVFKVFMNSSANGVHPSPDKWIFLQARDVSLIHKFEAGKYIIIPRLMPMEGQADEVPYVLSILSNKEIGSGDVTVNLKRLDKGNRVFENFPKFDPELIECEEPVKFQKRMPGTAFPTAATGNAL